MRILVLHGPNLNLLGRREPHIYGKETLADVNARLETLARELGTELVIAQSNHEGVLIDTLHANIDKADGAIINPAGITHYGVPLHDAIAAIISATVTVIPGRFTTRFDPHFAAARSCAWIKASTTRRGESSHTPVSAPTGQS